MTTYDEGMPDEVQTVERRSFNEFLGELSSKPSLRESLEYLFDRIEELLDQGLPRDGKAGDPAKLAEARALIRIHRERTMQAIVDNTRSDIEQNPEDWVPATDGSAADQVAVQGWPDLKTGDADARAAGIPPASNVTDAQRAQALRGEKAANEARRKSVQRKAGRNR